MAIGITAGSWVSSGTSLTVTLPASPQAGDKHVIFVGCKPYNTTINNLSGWNRLTGAGGSNGTVASGTDVGSVIWEVFWRDWQSGDGNPTLSLTGVNVALHCSWRIRPTAGGSTLDTPVGCKGQDTSSDITYSATMNSNPGITANDLILNMTVIAGNNSSFTLPTITATGTTLVAATESPATEGNTSTGNDLGASGSYASCTAGDASAAPVIGWTLGVAQTGGGALARFRETAPSSAFPYQRPPFPNLLPF